MKDRKFSGIKPNSFIKFNAHSEYEIELSNQNNSFNSYKRADDQKGTHLWPIAIAIIRYLCKTERQCQIAPLMQGPF